MKSKKQKGFTLIESILSIKLFVLLISTSMVLIYHYYSNQIISHQLYRGLICVEEYKKNIAKCEAKTLKNLKSSLKLHTGLKIDFKSSNFRNTGYFRSTFLTQKINIKKHYLKKIL